MTTNPLVRPAIAAALLLVPTGCITGEVPIGEDEQTLVFDPPDPGPSADPACAAYCAHAATQGCPPTDDCMAVCAAQRADAPSCGDLLDAFLACGGPLLRPGTCSLPGTPLDGDGSEPPDVELQSCYAALYGYDGCRFSAPGALSAVMRDRCGTLGFGAELDSSTMVIESTEVECTPRHFLPPVVMQATCAPGGVCSCLVDDEVVQTCQNLVHDVMLSAPYEGCCSRVFADVIDGLPL